MRTEEDRDELEVKKNRENIETRGQKVVEKIEAKHHVKIKRWGNGERERERKKESRNRLGKKGYLYIYIRARSTTGSEVSKEYIGQQIEHQIEHPSSAKAVAGLAF